MKATAHPLRLGRFRGSGVKCRVLIVEDDLTSANALRSILQRKGCDVLTATTLEEGLAFLSEPVDVILLDLMLPDGSGVEMLRRLREANCSTRVVVTTAVSDPALLREVQRLGPHRILRKPIDLVDLLSAIGMM